MKNYKTRILVTGGAGYIGSHACQELLKSEYDVLVVDNLSTGFKVSLPDGVHFVEGDVRKTDFMTKILSDYKPKGIIHLAAKLNVRESIDKPLQYYDNNIGGTISLLNACKAVGVNKIVFSSTGSIFGNEIQNRPIRELDPANPVNPYAWSKLICEKILEDEAQKGSLRYVSLRYFNVAGASDDGSNGQRNRNPFHLIHMASKVATGQQPSVTIYGKDYPTPDGTCIRDYIHIQDLAEIHVLALKYLLKDGKSEVFNCGYGYGYSVSEVISTVKKVSGVDFTVIDGERRLGDPISLIADNTKLKYTLGWTPKRPRLEQICHSAIRWEESLQRNLVFSNRLD